MPPKTLIDLELNHDALHDGEDGRDGEEGVVELWTGHVKASG